MIIKRVQQIIYQEITPVAHKEIYLSPFNSYNANYMSSIKIIKIIINKDYLDKKLKISKKLINFCCFFKLIL